MPWGYHKRGGVTYDADGAAAGKGERLAREEGGELSRDLIAPRVVGLASRGVILVLRVVFGLGRLVCVTHVADLAVLWAGVDLKRGMRGGVVWCASLEVTIDSPPAERTAAT